MKNLNLRQRYYFYNNIIEKDKNIRIRIIYLTVGFQFLSPYCDDYSVYLFRTHPILY